MSKHIKPSRSGKLLDSETWDALRKAGVPEEELQADQPFGPVIFSYTRAQAIEDGVLIDLTVLEITRQHWTVQLCCTDTVWGIIADAVTNHGRDLIGILHDLYTVAKFNIKPATSGQDRVYFKATVGVATHDFVLAYGPGDTAAPVLTLMLPSDD